MLDETSLTPNKNKLRLSLDFRIISGVLLALIVAMLLMWKPWDRPNTSDRTIDATGNATLSAEPDEYSFTPRYQFENAEQKLAQDALTKKSNELIAGLKKLGVEEKDIKTNSSNYNYCFGGRPDCKGFTYVLSLTAVVNNKELAQKVQDYLVGTSPCGNISPQVTFSDNKRKELENEARDKATADARSKADQSAKNLGFKVGDVKQVSDGSFSRDLGDYRDGAESLQAGSASDQSLTIQPGQNKLEYSIKVIFYVK